MTTACRILILYDQGNQIAALAQAIAEGACAVPGTDIVLRHPRQSGKDDLVAADALIIGTPNWTGIKGSLKLWMDTTGELWEEGVLAGKVAPGTFFQPGGQVSWVPDQIWVELRPFNDRQLCHDLEALCQQVATDASRLPDGCVLVFTVGPHRSFTSDLHRRC